jgi:hypothetical protein
MPCCFGKVMSSCHCIHTNTWLALCQALAPPLVTTHSANVLPFHILASDVQYQEATAQHAYDFTIRRLLSWKSFCIQYHWAASAFLLQAPNALTTFTYRVTVMSCHHHTLNSTDSAKLCNIIAWFQKNAFLYHYVNHSFSNKQKLAKIHFVTQILVLSSSCNKLFLSVFEN